MADDAVLIDALPGDVRIAVVQGGEVTDLLVDRAVAPSVAGSLFLGRVTAVTPAIDAAFVDIGLDRPGFLGLADARPTPKGGKDRIGDYVTEGQAVLVQALNDPTLDAGGAKGAKLTCRVTLPGRALVLTPGDGKVRLSRRLDDDGTLAALLAPLRPDDDTGFVVRTLAAEITADALTAQARALGATWADVQARAQDAKPPQLLWADDAVSRALRLAPMGAEVVLAGPDAASLRTRLAQDAPDMAVTIDDAGAARDIDDALEDALATEVPLPGGGTVTIEPTAALTAIDINIGTRTAGGAEDTALAVNLAAAREIARQLRLRNLGGLFAVDFARLKKPANRARVLAALRAGVAGDPEQVNVAGETTFGLIEMTRPRRRPALAAQLGGACSACAGTGRRVSSETRAFDALRAVLRETRAQSGRAVGLACAPDVAQALGGPCAPALAVVAERLGRDVDIAVDPAMLPGSFSLKTPD